MGLKNDFMNEPRDLVVGDVIYCNSPIECKRTFKQLQKLGIDGIVDSQYKITIIKTKEEEFKNE